MNKYIIILSLPLISYAASSEFRIDEVKIVNPTSADRMCPGDPVMGPITHGGRWAEYITKESSKDALPLPTLLPEPTVCTARLLSRMKHYAEDSIDFIQSSAPFSLPDTDMNVIASKPLGSLVVRSEITKEQHRDFIRKMIFGKLMKK